MQQNVRQARPTTLIFSALRAREFVMPSCGRSAVKRPDTPAAFGLVQPAHGTAIRGLSRNRFPQKLKTAGFPADFGLRTGVVAVQAR